MSSCPGFTLESYVLWDLDLRAEGHDEADFSMGLAEAIGIKAQRPLLSVEQFAPIIALFEPYREQVECALERFDDVSQSWRDYAIYAFTFIPDDVYEASRALLTEWGVKQ